MKFSDLVDNRIFGQGGEKSDYRRRRLLRGSRKGQGGGNANQCNELTPSHLALPPR